MKTLVVGGNFVSCEDGWGKPSKIIDQFAKAINADRIYNGGITNHLEEMDLAGFDLIFWAPNIDNNHEKWYPKKDRGAVLIVTKVLRENRTRTDALKRIFAMHGNAVVTVDKAKNPFKFELIDALNNSWGKSSNINDVANFISKLYKWTKESKRVGTEQYSTTDISLLIKINKQLADKFEQTPTGRYFGNLSTRCFKMFPTSRLDYKKIFVSKRNVDKKRITEEDMVLAFAKKGKVTYFGANKPSVDTPVQLSLYELFPNINFMIHGHAKIKNARTTKHYYPCGDMREVNEIEILINNGNNGIVNLKNHGFLIYAKTINDLQRLVDNLEFEK
jgi:ribulose-5-phosphate 4-epimerase/fuculose-1-phosphate aldolase